LFTEDIVKATAEALHQGNGVKCVLDAEPFFKCGPPPQAETIAALRKEILPYVSVLSATVPEAKQLLDNAGIPIDYPKSIADVGLMAKALLDLGPEYAIIKREILDETGDMTTLHFVLCGSGLEPVTVASRHKNPRKFFGVSYSIPREYRL